MGLTARTLPELMAFCKAKAVAGESFDGNPEDSSAWLEGAALGELRELADGCPVCMFAAVRQANVYTRGFEMKKELGDQWAAHNEARSAREYEYGC
jgi:hypothetical protein